jgi:hypothetical protein
VLSKKKYKTNVVFKIYGQAIDLIIFQEKGFQVVQKQ